MIVTYRSTDKDNIDAMDKVRGYVSECYAMALNIDMKETSKRCI